MFYSCHTEEEAFNSAVDLYCKAASSCGIQNVTLLVPYRKKVETVPLLNVNTLNVELQKRLNPAGDEVKAEGKTFRLNDPVMQLKNTPYSRRIMTNMYNFADLSEMKLEPCAYSMTFNVTENRLNGVLNQRSQDILAANNWNVVQYAVLIHMLAQVTGLIPGELVHVIADAHIYDRHIEIVRELIKRPQYPAPKFSLNPDIKDFYDFTTKDIKIENYQKNPQIKNIPIAV